MNKEERNTKIVAIIILVLVLCLGIYKLFFEKKITNEEKIDTETISVVSDPSEFYTVSSCVSSYVNNISSENEDNILILLSSNYKNENNIDKNNLRDYIEFFDENMFDPKKMKVQRVSKNTYKYYVYGIIQSEGMYGVSSSRDFYIIVYMDKENMTFAVEPYSGVIFE